MWIVPPPDDLIDLASAPLLPIDEIGAVALIDGIARIYYCRKTPGRRGEPMQRSVELVMERSIASIVDGMPKLLLLLQRLHGSGCHAPPAPFRPRLVRRED